VSALSVIWKSGHDLFLYLRYEREEVFFALNVTVKNNTLQDALAQFVKGELLEGDNAYFCEKCGEKV
jgi:ubiquitin carboxyl-terminal hydrolase 9/24